MARLYDGADDVVTCSIGACAITGASTLAIIGRRASAGDRAFQIHIGSATSSTPRFWMEVNTGNNQAYATGGTVRTGDSFPSASEWIFMAITRAAGVSTPRDHKYVYNTNGWSHSNMSGTAGNPTTPTTSVFLGNDPNVSTLGWNGELLMAACWDATFTDAQTECMPFSLAAWYQKPPVGLWILDQAATSQNVIDLTGLGANQSAITGTSVATVSSVIWTPGQAAAAA